MNGHCLSPLLPHILSFFVALELQDVVIVPDPFTQMPSTTWQLILEHMERPQAANKPMIVLLGQSKYDAQVFLAG